VIREYVGKGFIELLRTPTIELLTDAFAELHCHAQLEDFIADYF
jgi:hypothetical protein